jgi:hypothetical protein
MITNEMAAHIRSMLDYKYRTRHVHYYDKNGKSINEMRTPKPNKEHLIFSSNSYQNPTIDGLYNECIMQFEELLERLGGEFAEREDNSDKNSHRKITLHSLRRFVYSTVSDLGYNQFADKYMLGHSYAVSTYYRKSEKERIEIFKRIEPYITYLDTTALEKNGADLKTELESLRQDNIDLRNNMNKIMEMIQQNPKLAQVKPEALTKKIR